MMFEMSSSNFDYNFDMDAEGIFAVELFECKYCTREFRDLGELKIHMEEDIQRFTENVNFKHLFEMENEVFEISSDSDDNEIESPNKELEIPNVIVENPVFVPKEDLIFEVTNEDLKINVSVTKSSDKESSIVDSFDKSSKSPKSLPNIEKPSSKTKECFNNFPINKEKIQLKNIIKPPSKTKECFKSSYSDIILFDENQEEKLIENPKTVNSFDNEQALSISQESIIDVAEIRSNYEFTETLPPPSDSSSDFGDDFSLGQISEDSCEAPSLEISTTDVDNSVIKTDEIGTELKTQPDLSISKPDIINDNSMDSNPETSNNLRSQIISNMHNILSNERTYDEDFSTPRDNTDSSNTSVLSNTEDINISHDDESEDEDIDIETIEEPMNTLTNYNNVGLNKYVPASLKVKMEHNYCSRRRQHNVNCVLEKRRRMELRNLYSYLGNKLHLERPPKILILQSALEEIDNLKKKERAMMKERRKLLREIKIKKQLINLL